MKKSLINELSQLIKNQKLLLLKALWYSVTSNPEDVEVPDHQRSILEKRLQTLEEDKKMDLPGKKFVKSIYKTLCLKH